MKTDDDFLEICLACDDNYAPHAAALIASIATHREPGDSPRFFLLSEGISEKNKERFHEMARERNVPLEVIECSSEPFRGLPTWRGKYSTYFRLAIHRLLPETVSKVLYLDCDMIANTSLSPLFHTDLSGKYAAVVAEAEHSSFTTHDHPYFNAGMTLMNLEKYREDQIEQKAIELGKRRFSEIEFPDQDLANEIFGGNVVYLPLRWNTILFPEAYRRFIRVSNRSLAFSLEELETAISDPGLVHFAGFAPWKALCPHPLRELYWKHLRTTPFYPDVLRKYRLSWFREPYRKYFRIKLSRKNIHIKLFGFDLISYKFASSKKTTPT